MDTTKAGAISGAVGAVASVPLGLFEKYILKIVKVSFLDYASVLTVGQGVTDFWHFLVALIGHIVFGSILGIVFAFLINKTTNKDLLFKGAGYGSAIWLFTDGMGSLYKLPLFTAVEPDDCFFILVDAVIYGIVMAYVLQKLTNKLRR
jgi:hypothetical protein